VSRAKTNEQVELMQLTGQIHRKEVFPLSGYRFSKEFFFLIVLEIFTGSGNAYCNNF